MQIVSNGDNLHEMLKPLSNRDNLHEISKHNYVLGKIRKLSSLSSAELAQSMVEIKPSLHCLQTGLHLSVQVTRKRNRKVCHGCLLLLALAIQYSTQIQGWPRWLSWMRRLTGDQEVAGSTPSKVGSILSWRLIMKYFLRSFSPFR